MKSPNSKNIKKPQYIFTHILVFALFCSVFSLGFLANHSTVEAVDDFSSLNQQPGTINKPFGSGGGLNTIDGAGSSGGGGTTGGINSSGGGGTTGGVDSSGGGGATAGIDSSGGGGRTGGTTGYFTNPIKATSLAELLNDLLRIVTIIGAIVVVFFFILAGFNYVTARGDEKKISSATKTFTWTAVGAAIILGAQVIARVIQNTVNQLG